MSLIDHQTIWSKPIASKSEALARVYARPGGPRWTIPRIVALAGEDTVVGSLREVALAYDESTNTVKSSWRQCGLPGEPGRYRLAEIFLWLKRRDAKNAGLPDPYDPVAEAAELLAEKLAAQSHTTNGKAKK